MTKSYLVESSYPVQYFVFLYRSILMELDHHG
jgi:hypothetical protein